jgi:GNAT superfamily N-acetyltransferase
VKRHAEIYAQEYGWNEEFEALIAQLCADFIRKLNPARERCWIAERAGERLGCVFLVEESKTIARLRMLLVEPTARGLGVGTKLIEECLAFARAAGYRTMVLWTNDVLAAARRRYEAKVSTRTSRVVKRTSTKSMKSCCMLRRARISRRGSGMSGKLRRRFPNARSRCLRSTAYIRLPRLFATSRFNCTGQQCMAIETSRRPTYWIQSMKVFRSFFAIATGL